MDRANPGNGGGSGSGATCSGTDSWSSLQQIGLATYGTDAQGVARDSSGNIYMAGHTQANLVTGVGPATGTYDGLLTKYNAAGVRQWIRQFGVATYATVPTKVVVDISGNLYVAGYTQANLVTGAGAAAGVYDFFLAKYDSSSTRQWIQQVGVAAKTTVATGLTVDSSGNVYFVGYTNGNLVTGVGAATGTADMFFTKYDTNGNQQWLKQVGLATYQTIPYNPEIDAAGDIIVAGFTQGNIVAGAGAATGAMDLFLMKYNASGTQQWVRQLGLATYVTQGQGVITDSFNNIYLSGLTNGNLVAGAGAATGTFDLLLVKYDASGTRQWTRQAGVAAKTTVGFQIKKDASGNLYVAGYTSGNLVAGAGAATGTYDMFLMKLDSLGLTQWTRQIGVATYQTVGFGLVLDCAANSYVAGATQGNLVTGVGAATGSVDSFLTKYNAAGVAQ